MAKKIISLTEEDLLRLKTAVQITMKKMQEEAYEEQDIKPYKELYSALYASKIGQNGEYTKDYMLEVIEEEDDEKEEEEFIEVIMDYDDQEDDQSDDLRHK
jgi:hypothetical protein